MAPITSNVAAHLRMDRSITQLMLENVSNTDPLKIICEDTLTGKQATYGSLRQDAFRAAYSFRHEYGLRSNDIVTIISRSCGGPNADVVQVDYILAAQTNWAAGGIVSTINHSSSAGEIAQAIKIVKPAFFLVDATVERKLHEALDLLHPDTFESSHVITLVSKTAGYAMFPDDFFGHTRRIEPAAYVLDGKDARTVCAAIVLSSGTTGAPKAVMLSHHNLVAICEQLRTHNLDNWRGSMKEVFFPPLSHIYGLYVCALMGPWLGSYVCLMSSFKLDDFVRLLHEKRATLARLVPTVALALAESPVVQRYTYPDLEYFSCSAAPLKPSVATKLRKRFPGVSLCQTYGCTELSSCVSQSGTRDRDAPLVATGTLLANITVRFVNEEGRDVPSNIPGEICVSSPTIMMGYKDDEKATYESMLEPGWFKTGDIGYLDDKGYLIIVDRIKDVIKYKGFQVSPTELEEILSQHPKVADVGVTSVWNDLEATEMPKAFVVPVSSIKASDHQHLARELQALVAGKAAGYKRLRGGVQFIDQLPRNPRGKLLRRHLRDKALVKAHI